MGFGDLKSPQGLKALNDYLQDKSYVEGFVPSQADVVVLSALSGAPQANLPHALRWYTQINSYGSQKSSFPGVKKDLSAYGSAAANGGGGGDDDDDDEDDFDLFGAEDEDAEKLKQERIQQYAEKKSAKKAVIAKSSVVLYVKPWDDETDMKELEKLVRTIVIDGLLWGASKLVPVGYGINKLQISLVIEDEKVSMDDVQEQIEGFEDFVQSTDVAAFNKV